jgi:hypothetical protein
MTIRRALGITLGILGWAACGGNVRQGGDPGDTSGASGATSGGASGASGQAARGGVTSSTTRAGGSGGFVGSTGAGGFADGTGGTGGASIPGRCTPGPSQPLWLTNHAYDNTVRDLLAVTLQPSIATGFPDDSKDIGFRRDVVESTTESQIRLAHFIRAKDAVLENVRGHIAQLLPCDPATVGEDACASSFISSFGVRAYRRPITPEETAEFQKAYETGHSSGGFAQGIENVIGTALMSLHFLQAEEKGPPGVTELGPYAIASRLSYFVYRSMPDRELFDSAASGALTSPGEIEGQMRRMLADPKAHPTVIAFFSDWLSLDRLTGTPWNMVEATTKDPAIAPTFPTLRGYMRTETEKFAESVFFGDSLLTTLLTGTKTWLNEPLAALYGVAGLTGLEFRPVTVDPGTRAGILTHASLLSILGSSIRASPVQRGKFVSERFGCVDLPPPPANVPPPIEPPGSGTYRQHLDATVSGAACRSCHVYLEGIGYGFEEFDIIGRHQTMEGMLPIDSSAALPTNFGSVAGPFVGAIELSKKLSSSAEVRACVAKQWFRFALSRRETDEDECSLRVIRAAFAAGNMRELLVAIAKSPAFLQGRW